MAHSEVSVWAEEYLVHTPCHELETVDDGWAMMVYLYEDSEHPEMLTGLKCERCGYTVDLVPRVV